MEPNFGNLESVLQRQRTDANRLKKELPGAITGFGEQQKQGAYKQLDKEAYQNKKDFGRRGLLYSGLRQAADVDATAQTAAALAQRQQDFAQDQRQRVYGAADQADATGMLLQGARQSRLDAERASAEAELAMLRGRGEQADRAFSGLLSGVGELGGMAIARSGNKKGV